MDMVNVHQPELYLVALAIIGALTIFILMVYAIGKIIDHVIETREKLDHIIEWIDSEDEEKPSEKE